MGKMTAWHLIPCMAALAFAAAGCATTARPAPQSQLAAVEQPTVQFPPYDGPKRRVQVVEIEIPEKDLEHYPELAEKRVGFGLSSILVEALFDSGRFDLLEGQDEILKRHLNLWQRTADGFYLKDQPPAGLAAPEFLVYAKVFDFVPCSPMERIGLTGKELSCVTSVGVQVRIENTAGQYVPGTTDPLSPQAQYVHSKTLSLLGSPQVAFDQSAVGKATWKAMRYALLQALTRLDRQGW